MNNFNLYIWILVLALSSADERGNVLEFSPKGNFNFLFSKHENDIQSEEGKLVDTTIKTGTTSNAKSIKLVCNKFEMNSNTDYVITEYRAALTVGDDEDVELESLRVGQCVEQELKFNIMVTQSVDDALRKEFRVLFIDTQGGCRQRDYTVEYSPEEDSPIVAITRTKAILPYGWKLCPIKGEIKKLVSGWYEDGTTHDYTMFSHYDTKYRFGCTMCWVMCKKVDSRYIVDLVVHSAPLDRLKVSSCTKAALLISIKLDYHERKRDERIKTLSMNFLKPNGSCYSRKYQYDIQVTKNTMLERAIVKRYDPELNPGCKTMKLTGLARFWAIKAKRNFVNFIDCPQKSEDEKAKDTESQERGATTTGNSEP